MKKRFYITTPIYYPSGNPHIGHAYCSTMADILARDRRMRHFETYFLTGTDEHGQKIQKNATAAGLDPQTYVDGIVANFRKLWDAMKISNDDYIRTTEERHIKCVQQVFSKLYEIQFPVLINKVLLEPSHSYIYVSSMVVFSGQCQNE